MKKTIPKSEVRKQVEEFFENVKSKTPKEIKKIKRLAMAYNIPLKEKRRLFCKKCLAPYSGGEKIRVREGIKSVECGNCGKRGRWKLTDH